MQLSIWRFKWDLDDSNLTDTLTIFFLSIAELVWPCAIAKVGFREKNFLFTANCVIKVDQSGIYCVKEI